MARLPLVLTTASLLAFAIAVFVKEAHISDLDVAVLMCLGLVTWSIVVAMAALHMATETASDIYRCRKLLEIIANRIDDE